MRLHTGEVDNDDTGDVDHDDEELLSCSPTNVISRKQHRLGEGCRIHLLDLLHLLHSPYLICRLGLHQYRCKIKIAFGYGCLNDRIKRRCRFLKMFTIEMIHLISHSLRIHRPVYHIFSLGTTAQCKSEDRIGMRKPPRTHSFDSLFGYK